MSVETESYSMKQFFRDKRDWLPTAGHELTRVAMALCKEAESYDEPLQLLVLGFGET